MKRILKKFEMTIVLLIKEALYLSLFATFFLLFAIKNRPLLVMSRTMAVTTVTYVFVGVVLTAIYGRFDIGKRKSKPIIYSISLATIITDIFTYLLLQIMNTNPNNNTSFKLEHLWILGLVIVVQILLIIIFTYFGNYIFFVINPPERCIIITSSQKSLDEVARGVCRFKKQYQIVDVADYRRPGLYKHILAAQTVFIYDVPVKERTEIVDFCYQNTRNVYYNPEIADVVEINSKHVMVDDVSLIGSDFRDLTLEQKLVKRTMDLVLSLFCLIVMSPVMLACAIAVKVDDRGRVIFKQQRATKNGRVFELYKFRTMKENVRNYSATTDDDRITKVGRFLRKYRLDELPQLINIIKGDMSFVGPRPEMLSNIYEYTQELPEFQYRLRVKAGLTGYAQIMGKYNTSPKDKLILDLMYIESYSFWKDLQLLFQTLIVLLKSEDSTEGFKQRKDSGIEGDFYDE